MRCWISPDLKIVEIDGEDSHAILVTVDPEAFGIDSAAMNDHLSDVDSEETVLDYETIIVLAQMSGWVRTSNDGQKGNKLAVGASDPESARQALLRLEENGMLLGEVELNIERVIGHDIHWSFINLDVDQTVRFLKRGHLPATAPGGEMPIEATDLADRTLASPARRP